MSLQAHCASLLLFLAICPACSSESGLSGRSTKSKVKPVSNANAESEKPSADQEQAGSDTQVEGSQEKGSTETDDVGVDKSDKSVKVTKEDDLIVKDPGPSIDEASNLPNLNGSEIIIVRRLPNTTVSMSFFYYSENDSLRDRGINLATNHNMDPNFTIFPKTLESVDYFTAITDLGSARWEGFLADRGRAIKAFLGTIEAKGIENFNASTCRQYQDTNPISSDPSVGIPASEQIQILLNVPTATGKLSYEFRETSGSGCGQVNPAKFAAAAAHLLDRARKVRVAGFRWQAPSAISLSTGACPVVYQPICGL